jgi:ADP-ribose pyrophosphatase YjhB (NUDIX family)/predicted acetyltransferase
VPREPLSDPRPRAVAVVERDGKVLVIRRHLDGRDYAVLPGGGVEDGEAPADAALRELREECTLDGRVAQLLLEGDHGGRTAFYYRVTGVEGEPVLGGEEGEHQDETNQHHPMWASPKDLELMGLLPDGLTELVVGWLWPFRVRAASSSEDWAAVEHLWQPYSHDLSEFRGSTPGPDGTFKRGHLDFFHADANCVAYLAVQGDRPVVVRSVRRRGVARTFAEQVVRAHPGSWWIAFQEENEKAARFWRRLAGEVLTGSTEELRAVPDKPYIPPDVWLSGSVGG